MVTKRDRDWKTREDNDGNWEGWTKEWEKGGREKWGGQNRGRDNERREIREKGGWKPRGEGREETRGIGDEGKEGEMGRKGWREGKRQGMKGGRREWMKR